MNHFERHPYSHRRFADRKVLVLHPDPPMCERICTALQIEGCQAAYATDPKEFHLLLVKGVPDVIVVGEAPSGFDGLDALAQILSTHPMVPTFLIIPDANVDRAVAAPRT